MKYQQTPIWLVYYNRNGEDEFRIIKEKNEQLMKTAVETGTQDIELLDYQQLDSSMENLTRALRNNKYFLAHLEIQLMSSLEEDSNPDVEEIFYNKETFGNTLESLLENKYSNEKIVGELNILIQTCRELKEEGG
jgi:hypothetical protein